jgi:hypothetical protein
MAVPKKGWRPLVVNQRRYFWRAIGTDGGINVVVVTEAAFTRGATAQQLTFELDYNHTYTQLYAGAFSMKQRTAVAPGVVALAIQRALALSPSFTGDVGKENITLPRQVVIELQQRARIGSAGAP